MDCSLEHQCSTTDAKRSRSASTASFQNSVAPLHTHNQHTHTLIPDTTDRTALLSTWKNRLSGLFSTTPTENTYRASTGDLINGKRESKYWRPMPLQEPNISMKKLYFTHSRDGCVMIVGADKTSTVYKTSIKVRRLASPSSSSSVFDIKAEISNGQSTAQVASIRKDGNDITVDIDGLFPIIFYRARPDCILPVNCFVARKMASMLCSATTMAVGDSLYDCQDAIAKHVTISFAWKHTTVSGTRGLKLVDLRDNEIIAYYQLCKTKRNYWAKLRVQGSGLQLVPLIVATILALRYGNSLKSSSAKSANPQDASRTSDIAQQQQQQQDQEQQRRQWQGVTPAKNIVSTGPVRPPVSRSRISQDRPRSITRLKSAQNMASHRVSTIPEVPEDQPLSLSPSAADDQFHFRFRV